MKELFITYSIINTETGETLGSEFSNEHEAYIFILENGICYTDYELRKTLKLSYA